MVQGLYRLRRLKAQARYRKITENHPRPSVYSGGLELFRLHTISFGHGANRTVLINRSASSEGFKCKLLLKENKMHRLDFTPYRRTTVGFDRLFDILENAGRATQGDNYPPFNIERMAENNYLVTIAVAGFKPDEIDITAQQNLLVVAGQKHSEGNDNRDFLHVGIANRNFERRFQLADHVFVKGADIADGLLVIELERQVPDELKPRKIMIGGTMPTVIESEKAEKKSGKAA
jgi:molecular chaperone IbpA